MEEDYELKGVIPIVISQLTNMAKRLHTSLSTEIFKEEYLVHIKQRAFFSKFSPAARYYIFIFYNNLPSQISITCHVKRVTKCVVKCVLHRQKGVGVHLKINKGKNKGVGGNKKGAWMGLANYVFNIVG